MQPLPAHTVQLVLEYVSPPTDPLPPHLVSTPLRQRHHFLQIPPSSPVDYLCWPSPDNARIIDLLDRLPALPDQASYPTRYTSDPESTFAHVQISSNAPGLRMLFHWDDTHAWRYHDLQLMPFPSSSFSTPHASLAANSARGAAHLPHPSLDHVAEADRTDSDSDDSYWDSYSHDPTCPSPPRNASEPDAVGEDAYWAQYASVQGSADSTVPSPLPSTRKLRPVKSSNGEPSLPQNDAVIHVPADAIRSRPRPGPPSPDVLVHLLNTISPRKDVDSPVPDDPYPFQSPSAYSTDPSPDQTTADSELVTPPLPDEYLDAVVSPLAVKAFQCRPHPLHETEDKALTESIKGLYYLWKSGRKGEPSEKDRNVFLQIVHEAVAYE